MNFTLRLLKSKLLQGAGLIFVIQMTSKGIAYITQILLVRWMGITQYGQYAYIMAWVTVLSVLSGIGFNTSTLRFIPEYIATKQFQYARGFIKTSRGLVFSVGVLASIVGSLVVLVSGANSTYPALILGLFVIPILTLINLQSESLRALGIMLWAYGPSLLLRSSLVLLIAAVLEISRFRLTSFHLVTGVYAALLIVFLIQYMGWKRRTPTAVSDSSPRYRNREWIKVSATLLLVTGFQLVMNQSDLLLIGVFNAPRAVGSYNVAVKVATLLSYVSVAVISVVAPQISKLHAVDDKKRLRSLLAYTGHATFWPAIVFAAILFGFRHSIIQLFGSDASGAILPMAILLLGQVANAISVSAPYLLNLTGRHSYSAIIYSVTAFINLIANIFVIPHFGIVGAATVTTSTFILWNVALHYVVVAKMKLYPSLPAVLWEFLTTTRRAT